MKQETKEKLKNLFDNDPSNSNNIFDRIQDQMTSPSVDKRIDEVMRSMQKNAEEEPKEADYTREQI